MDTLGVSTFRTHGRITRTIATVVILTFGGLITSPAVAATRAEIERQERPAPREKSPSEKLNAALRDVKAQLRMLAGAPEAGAARAAKTQPEAPAARSTEERAARQTARDALKTLHDELKALDKNARDDFRRIGKELKAKNLPEVILKRHADAVARYEAEADALLNDLAIIGTETADESMLAERAAKAFERLERTKLRKSQQPFDPNNLPNRSLPAERKAPKFMTPHFINSEALLDDAINLETALAAVGEFDFSAVEGADDPALLSESAEVVLSDAIRVKAEELEHNPVNIFNWVRNNVQWQPTWGAVQDADLTLSAQRGNAFDIASLTIALLRASGIPARYVHGTIDVPEDRFRNWIGGFEHIDAAIDYAAAGGIPIRAIVANGKSTKVRMEYIWVEAALDFYPSRGAVNRKADIWVSLDPAFKQYEFLEGLDPVAISGLDPEQLAEDFLSSGTVNADEGWVTGFDPTVLQNAQDQAQQALTTYIDQNLPDATVGDVLGGRRIIEQNLPILAGTLSNYIIATGVRYAELPDSLRQHITFGFGRDVQGEPVHSIRFKWAAVNNERITLSFKPATQADEDTLESLLPEGEITDISQLPDSIPAYLINVVPELKVNDDIVMTGSAMNLGEELTFTFTPEFAGRYAIPNTYNVVAGSYLAVAAIAGNVSPQALDDSKTRLEQTKAILEAQNPDQLDDLTREDLLGDLFHAGLLGYYGQFTALSYVAGLKQGSHHYLAAGLGSFGYEPAVDYIFGMPQNIHGGGAAMNIPIVNVYGYAGDGSAGSKQNRLNYVLQTGTLSSALEHAVPEQMFVTEDNPGEAVSAVKALGKASAAGQRVYYITPANRTAVLPNIHHDSLVMNEISNALAIGKEVITHTDVVSVPGWSGAGYIIYDPITGDGAYKISGGMSGGYSLMGDIAEEIYALTVAVLGSVEEIIDFLFTLIGIVGTALSEISDEFIDASAKLAGAVLSVVSTVYDVVKAFVDCYGIMQLVIPVLILSLALLAEALSLGLLTAVVFSVLASIASYFLVEEYC